MYYNQLPSFDSRREGYPPEPGPMPKDPLMPPPIPEYPAGPFQPYQQYPPLPGYTGEAGPFYPSQPMPYPIMQPPIVQPIYITFVPVAPAGVNVAPAKKNKDINLVITGFVLGISSLVCCFYPCGIGLLASILGITFSALGLRSTQQRVLAILGLVFSFVGMLLTILLFPVSSLPLLLH